jgi:thymidylate synthase (FAD)
MTSQESILQDDRYIPVHNAGFVGLIDVMGDDADIVQAARVSYGKGTKSWSEDNALIRYMMRHRHTSPFEMMEFKFHLKMPIFVMRQHVRHRTANMNEYSARYSELSDEFYFPQPHYLMPQSTTNKQGRSGEYSHEEATLIQNLMLKVYEASYNGYQYLLKNFELSRELARLIMPVACYTECYWKVDLKNLLHYFSLRRDPHAQKEIQDFANTMFKLVEPYCPMAIKAWEDYQFNSYTCSRMEVELLKRILSVYQTPPFDDKTFEELGMSKREAQEFKSTFFGGVNS